MTTHDRARHADRDSSEEPRPYICRHGKTRAEHDCDDHRDHSWAAIGAAQKAARLDAYSQEAHAAVVKAAQERYRATPSTAAAGSDPTHTPDAGMSLDPAYSRSKCGRCGGQEAWCSKCSAPLCECFTPAPTEGSEGCVCEPDGLCLGVPGETDQCKACLALDPECGCLNETEPEPECICAMTEASMRACPIHGEHATEGSQP